MKLPRLVGHRGAAAHAPENTLAGIRAARDFGLDWVEFDSQLTGDGVPVLMHDDTLQRTTGDPRKIAEVPAAEVIQLDAGSWFDGRFSLERVPTLEAAATLLEELDLRVNVEIKPSPGLARETGIATVSLLKRLWSPTRPLPLFSCFQAEALEEARRLWPEAPRGYLMRSLAADWRETATRLECVSIHLWHPGIRPDQAKSIKAAGYQLAAYTVNEPARAARLLEIGLDCLISDDPPALAPICGESAAA